MVLEERIVQANSKLCGEPYTDSLIAMENLAATYNRLKRWAEAEALEEDSTSNNQVIWRSTCCDGECHGKTRCDVRKAGTLD